MKKSILLLIIFFITTHLNAQEQLEKEAQIFAFIDTWLEAQKDFDQLPGITVNFIEDQEVIWKGAYGYANVDDQISADTETLFSICSISKLFTSIAIMKLYEEGKLRLDDRIEDVLPWYDLAQQFGTSGPITVKSLLTHSSGLPREAIKPYWTGPDFPFPSESEIQEGLSTQKTLYPASTYFQYSNLGLTLLGEIIEEVSGEQYDVYIYENIIKPLGLADTRTSMPQDLYGSELAIGYSAIKRDAQREKVNLFDANGIKAAAGFSSNVEDLGKFAAWQFRLLDSEEKEILNPATLKEMQRVHWTNNDFGLTWGLGFSVRKGANGQKIVGHGGSCPGYRSSLQLNPKTKEAISVMINAGGTNPSKYADGVMGLYSKLKGGWSEPTEASENWAEYTGLYNQQPWWSESFIAPIGDKLAQISLPSNDPGASVAFFKHIEGDIFMRLRDGREISETLTFQRDANGKVISYAVHGNYSTKL